MWKQYFKFVKLKPGKVVTSQFGEIDFGADNIGIEIIKALYENGFPYLEITDNGKAVLYEYEHIKQIIIFDDKKKSTKKSNVISKKQ